MLHTLQQPDKKLQSEEQNDIKWKAQHMTLNLFKNKKQPTPKTKMKTSTKTKEQTNNTDRKYVEWFC